MAGGLSNTMAGAMDQVNAQKGGSRSGNLGNGVSYLKGRGGGWYVPFFHFFLIRLFVNSD